MTSSAIKIATFFFACVLAPPIHAGVQELPDFIRLVRNQGAVVVNISTIQRNRNAPVLDGAETRLGEMPAPRVPFDDAPDSDASSLGSGFIIASDGLILTCAHVVEDAREIVVRLIDRREFRARLLGIDTRTDVALLKIDAASLPQAVIGNTAKLEVGEWVLAIGSPFGFQHSATAGIVSAVGRSLPQENYIPFIQTDVPINPGNSGGPLFNLRGQVIGMNSQIYSRNGGFMGLSFAVPIELAMSVADQLKRDGRLRRGWLGVSPQEVTHGLAIAYGLARPRGALIADILPESPAARSDLRSGDIVLDYQGKPVEFSTDLPLFVAQTPPRTAVKLRVQRRDSGASDIQVTIGELQEPVRESRIPEQTRPKLALAELGEAQRRQERIPQGVVVESVNIAASQAGLRSGDIVVEADGKRVVSVADLQRRLSQAPVGTYVLLRVRRAAQMLYVAVPAGG